MRVILCDFGGSFFKCANVQQTEILSYNYILAGKVEVLNIVFVLLIAVLRLIFSLKCVIEF